MVELLGSLRPGDVGTARFAANASPEPVHAGRTVTVTVTGRLTRANWDAYRNPMQGFDRLPRAGTGPP